MRKIIKLLGFGFVAALAALSILSVGSFAYAEEQNVISATVLNNSGNAIYHKFDSPSGIFASSESLIVKVKGGYEEIVSGGAIFTESEATDFAYIDGLIALSDGDICYGDEVISGDYLAISSYGNTLYALSESAIERFDYSGGELIKNSETITPTYPVTKIAAAEGGCLYAVTDARNMSVIYLNGQKKYELKEAVLALGYAQNVYVLTPSGVISYTDEYNSLKFDLTNGYDMCVGEEVYVLTRLGEIDRISLSLDEAGTLIATSSEDDWFYSDPVCGDTRLGKIYVVDKAIGDERTSGRVAVIDGDKISYLTGLKQPVAVAADNNGVVYVAHYGNHVSTFENSRLVDDLVINEGNIVDLAVDSADKLHILTENGDVIKDGTVIKSGVKAMEYASGWHYMTTGFIGDIEIGAIDFAVDILGNIFCVTGDNEIASIIGGNITRYTVDNASKLTAITISKVANDYIGYGDLILCDEFGQCVLTVNGESVGSADVNDLYTPPTLSGDPCVQSEGVIGKATSKAYMFVLPIEGQISRTLLPGENVIVCKDIEAPEPYVYCICDDVTNERLSGGYVYESSLEFLPYVDPAKNEAKINIDNTPVYKYPTRYSPEVTKFAQGTLVEILPFAYTSSDETEHWYTDGFGDKWRRIAFGYKEGYVLNSNLNMEFFSNVEMPKTNATIIRDAELYRYDAESKKYIRFEAAGETLIKDTRVVVDTPFDTSREYTKVVFYRENYGTIDVECYVRTEDIKFDGVDIIKIVAVAVIVVALITLIAVIIIKRRNASRPEKKRIED